MSLLSERQSSDDFRQQSKRASVEKPPLPTAEFGLIFGVLEFFSTCYDRAFGEVSREKFKIWQSQSYIERIRDGWGQERVLGILNQELQTLFHEYVGFLAKKEYPYGPRGIRNLYPEPMSVSGQRWVVSRSLEGKDVRRATLDRDVMVWLERWMETSAEGDRILLISPRGEKSDGYPGLESKHYVFVNVFQKCAPDALFPIHFTQYLSFDTEKDLALLQNTLVRDHRAKTTAIDTTIIPKKISEELLIRPIFLPQKLADGELEGIIYSQEHTWPTRLSELPQFDPSVFQQQVERVTNHCVAHASKLLTSEPELFEASFSLLVETAKEVCLSWVQETTKKQRPKQQSVVATTRLPEEGVNLFMIDEIWELKKQGAALSSAERRRLGHMTGSIALAPNSTLKHLSSVGHCTTSAPQIQLSQKDETRSGTQESTTKTAADNEKNKLQHPSKNYKRILLPNGSAWYVLEEFAEVYQQLSIVRNGVAIGPCGVNLDLDSFVLSAAEFELLLQSEKREPNNCGVKKRLMSNTGNPDLQENNDASQARDVLRQAIVRNSLNLHQFLTGDVLDENVVFSLPLQEKDHKRLILSTNPLNDLDEIMGKLHPVVGGDGEKTVLTTTEIALL